MTTNSRLQPIERATNKSWDEWLQFMEKIDAKHMTHHEIATKVLEELMGKVTNPAWWAQSVAVAYEQHIGKRLPGQRPDGSFQTSVSKATDLGMQELMDKWTDFAAKDKEVLDIIGADVRVSGTENRITWRTKSKDGATIIMMSEPKGGNTASVIVQLIGQQTLELNDEAKTKWAAIVERFITSL
jgi:hypothetical protein